jgi:hypothetical protein
MKLKEAILATLFFLFAAAFIHSPIVLENNLLVTTGLIQSDLMNQNFPFHWQYAAELKRGKLWLWTQLIGDGFPVFATGQSGGLYPINLVLFRFLPPLAAFNLNLFIHLVLAGAGVYWYCRHFDLSRSAALLGGLAFAFSGFLTTHLMHVAMIQVASWIPLSLLILEKCLQRRGRNWWLVLAAVWAGQALAGHHELLFFSLLIEFFYLGLRIAGGASPHLGLGRTWLKFGLSGGLALLLAAPQILPTLELTSRSPRQGGVSFAEATGYQFPLRHLATLVNPHAFKFSETVRYETSSPDAVNLWETYLYLGLVPLGFAVLGTIVAKRGSPFPKTTWMIVLLASFLLARGRRGLAFPLLWKALPLVRFFKSPTRFLVFFELALSVLAAFGWDRLLKKKPRLLYLALTLTLIPATVLDLKLNNAGLHRVDKPRFWLNPPPTARLLAFSRGGRYHSLSTNHFDYRLIDDLPAQRELTNLLPSDYGMLFRLPAAAFQAGLFTRDQLRLLRGRPEERLAWNDDEQEFVVPPAWLERMNLQAVEFILSPFPLNHSRLRLMGSFGFPQSMPGQLLFPAAAGGYQPVSVKAVFVYRNLSAWPRAFLVPTSLLSRIDNEQIAPSSISPSRLFRRLGGVIITKAAESELILNVYAQKPAVLVLLDLDYPGWQARLDDTAISSFQALGSFRGVNVPAGRHQIKWVYQPNSFRGGLVLALAGIIIAAGTAVLKINASPLPPGAKAGKEHQSD